MLEIIQFGVDDGVQRRQVSDDFEVTEDIRTEHAAWLGRDKTNTHTLELQQGKTRVVVERREHPQSEQHDFFCSLPAGTHDNAENALVTVLDTKRRQLRRSTEKPGPDRRIVVLADGGADVLRRLYDFDPFGHTVSAAAIMQRFLEQPDNVVDAVFEGYQAQSLHGQGASSSPSKFRTEGPTKTMTSWSTDSSRTRRQGRSSNPDFQACQPPWRSVLSLRTQADRGTISASPKPEHTMGLIGTLFVGLIVGAIARFLMPGDQKMGWIMTMLVGVGGSLVAGYFGQVLGWYHAGQGAGWIASVVGAVVLLFAVGKLRGGPSS